MLSVDSDLTFPPNDSDSSFFEFSLVSPDILDSDSVEPFISSETVDSVDTSPLLLLASSESVT